MRPDILAHCRSAQLAYARTWTADEDAELRAVYARLVLARELSFEDAMQSPAVAIAVRNTARALRHTPRELFNEEAK